MLIILAFALSLQVQQTPPPDFKSAPLHGTIDAGGYAASATAKTQSQLFNQLVDLQLAATLDPNCEIRKGLAYEAQGQLEAAAEQFRVASNETAYGIALLFQGQAEKAAAVCHAACLGAALFQEGQIPQSLDVFFQAGAYGFIATALSSADPETCARAIDRLVTLASTHPASAAIQYALATALSDPDQSEAHLRQAISLDPQLAVAHFRLGTLYEAKGERTQAIPELQMSLKLDPRLIEAHYRLSQLYIRSGSLDQGRSELVLYQQLKSQQKTENESNRIPTHAHACP
jgi:tetratricopeptide (TPR) repeat protein